jgi:hypothetical protein
MRASAARSTSLLMPSEGRAVAGRGAGAGAGGGSGSGGGGGGGGGAGGGGGRAGRAGAGGACALLEPAAPAAASGGHPAARSRLAHSRDVSTTPSARSCSSMAANETVQRSDEAVTPAKARGLTARCGTPSSVSPARTRDRADALESREPPEPGASGACTPAPLPSCGDGCRCDSMLSAIGERVETGVAGGGTRAGT